MLRANGQRVVVVIASDGAATDGDIEVAMRPLRRLMARLDDVDGPPASGDAASGDADDAAAAAAVGPVTAEDVAGALAQSRSTHTRMHARRYEEWTLSFGMNAG